MNNINDIKTYLNQEHIKNYSPYGAVKMFTVAATILEKLPPYEWAMIKIGGVSFEGTPHTVGTVLYAHIVADTDWIDNLTITTREYRYDLQDDPANIVRRYNR